MLPELLAATHIAQLRGEQLCGHDVIVATAMAAASLCSQYVRMSASVRYACMRIQAINACASPMLCLQVISTQKGNPIEHGFQMQRRLQPCV